MPTDRDMQMKPTIGRVVHFQTDGRGGRQYELPAMVTCVRSSHPDLGVNPGKLPANPVPIPVDDWTVHLTVYTPGGGPDGSGSYVELSVPWAPAGTPRSWHWPERA